MSKHLKATVSTDQSTATLQFFGENDSSHVIKLTKNDLSSLIQTLGQVRTSMMKEGDPIPQLEGLQINAIFDTRWHIDPQMMGEATLLSFQHPAYGPLGFLIPIDQIPLMIRLLTEQVTASIQSRSASKN